MSTLDLHPARGSTRFTLRGLFRDEHHAQQKTEALVRDGFVAWNAPIESPRGNQIFLVAARHDVTPLRRAGIPHTHSVDWEATRLAIAVFRRMLRAGRAAGRTPRWYKSLDVAALHSCIQRYKWNGPRLDVATDILSSTILTHPFPNANHRTALELARLYLASEGVPWPGFDLRGRGARRLFRQTHTFFRESKYLLQLVRHQNMVRLAFEEGWTRLGIGESSEAVIRDVDLTKTAQELRAAHQELCSMTIMSLAGEKSKTGLAEPGKRRPREWVAWFRL
ncbi:MAG: hypothetical protein HY556_06005 [Euryarchaeota archaeon]|nr:hypothetical protein [Euryarchaeota archaeon]